MFSFEGPDRRKEEERVLSEGRLPPGQSLTLKFPVLHYGPVPHFNPASRQSPADQVLRLSAQMLVSIKLSRLRSYCRRGDGP